MVGSLFLLGNFIGLCVQLHVDLLSVDVRICFLIDMLFLIPLGYRMEDDFFPKKCFSCFSDRIMSFPEVVLEKIFCVYVSPLGRSRMPFMMRLVPFFCVHGRDSC